MYGWMLWCALAAPQADPQTPQPDAPLAGAPEQEASGEGAAQQGTPSPEEIRQAADQLKSSRFAEREAGYRTKVAVNSLDSKVDAVGACVGVRGSRIKSIVDELGGEKIDIVRWNDSSKILIANTCNSGRFLDG